MIRPLRQRHRRAMIALGVVLPVMFVVGIAARKPAPTVARLPAALAATPQTFKVVEWERADLYAKTPVQVRLLRGENNSGRFAVQFSAANDFIKPDLLVYWVGGNPALAGTLPDQAILLGEFGPMALPLPDDAGQSTGVLVLFSLAGNEIVDVSRPIRLTDSGN